MLIVSSHNLADALSDAEKIPVFLDSVDQQRPDILVLPEAYGEDKITYLANVEKALEREHYSFLHVLNNDADDRKDRHGTAVIYRSTHDVLKAEAVRLATRNALQLHMRDPETGRVVNVIGAHLDDRHEANRLVQAKAAIEGINPNLPSVFAGDCNSMNKRDWKRFAPLLFGKFIAPHLPVKEPGEKASKLERVGSLTQRLGEMATGDTVELFLDAGMREAGHYERTMMARGIPLFNLDHMFVTQMDVDFAGPDKVGGLSDHCRISADLSVYPAVR